MGTAISPGIGMGRQSPTNQPTATATPQVDPQISAWMEETWRNVKESYTSYHQMAMEAILMQAGETWVRWDATRKIFEPDAPQDDWTPTPRINRFAPTIDSICANVMNIPEIEATVSGQKDDPLLWAMADIATKLGNDFLKCNGVRRNSNAEDDKVGEAGMAFVLCGCVFTEVQKYVLKTLNMPVQQAVQVQQAQCQACGQFNHDMQPVPGTDNSYSCGQCGQQVQPQPAQVMKQPTDPATGQPITQPVDMYDAELQIRLPLFALPRPGSKGMDSTPYLFWGEREEINYIRSPKGCNVPDAQPDNEQLDGFSVGYEHALNYFYQGVSQTTKSIQDSALVVRAFVPPDSLLDFPQGFTATMVNGKVKRVDPWDGTTGHPMTFAVYQRLLTLFFGRSVAFELAGVQKEYQSYESLIKLHAMTSAVDPIIIDINTQVSEITGRADKLIKWRGLGPGSKEPHRMQHGSLDEGVYRQRQSLRDEFENISGAVSVYRGMQPGSITAASAIDKLQGQAEMMFNKPVQNWNALWVNSVIKGVKIRQKYWIPAQIAAVVGDDKMSHIMRFKSADLDSLLEWVATSHGLPRSRDEKKREMLELFDRGALDINSPVVRQKAFELFGDLGVMTDFNLDATRARTENLAMKNGQPAKVMVGIEDLGVHLAVHLQAVKQLDFDQWPDLSKQLILEHIMETQQAISQQQMAQAAAAGPSSAGPQGGATGGTGAGRPGPAGHGRPQGQPKRGPAKMSPQRGPVQADAAPRPQPGPMGGGMVGGGGQ